jgi:hypothetical protein
MRHSAKAAWRATVGHRAMPESPKPRRAYARSVATATLENSMAATGPAVTLPCWSFRASQQTKPNVSSATPASRPTSDPEPVSRGEPIRSETSRDGEAASANPVAASSSAVTLSNVFNDGFRCRLKSGN